MKNLTKYSLLLIIGALLLLFATAAEKAIGGAPTPTPACTLENKVGKSYSETCTGVDGPIASRCDTATSYQYALCSATACYYGLDSSCTGGKVCIINVDGAPACVTLTPTPAPGAPTSVPTSVLKWTLVATCTSTTQQPAPTTAAQIIPTSTPTSTPTPNLFNCINQIGPASGNYQCAEIINGSVQCPPNFGVYLPSPEYTGTSCDTNQGCCKQGETAQPNLFACQDQIAGTLKGNYICADIVNESPQCPEGYTSFNLPSSYSGTSCGLKRGCCKQNPSVPTPTSTLTPTPFPGSTVIDLSLALEGIEAKRTLLSTIGVSSVTIKAFQDTDTDRKNPVSTKQGLVVYNSVNGKFKGTVDLGILLKGNYLVTIKIDQYLQKLSPNIFTAEGGTKIQTIPITATLTPGNINGDNVIDALDFNAVLNCYGAKANTTGCQGENSADLNADRKVDIIDLNIVLRNYGKTDD